MNRAEALKALVVLASGGLRTTPPSGVSATQSDERGVVNVRSYGALGNGAADDTEAIRRAVAATQGRCCLFPPGSYLINPASPIEIPSGATLDFSGHRATVVLKENAILPADKYVFAVPLGADNVRVLDINMEGRWSSQSKRLRALVAFKARDLLISNPRIVDFSGSALVLSNCPRARVLFPSIRNCGRRRSGTAPEQGIAITSDVPASDPYLGADCSILGGYVDACGLDGLIWNTPFGRVMGFSASGNGVDVDAAGLWFGTRADGLLIDACHSERNSGNGIDAGPNRSRPRGIRILSNECHDNGRAGIQVDDAEEVWIEGNRCFNNGRTGRGKQRGGIVLASNGTVDRVCVRYNRCFDEQAGPTQEWGLQMGAANTSKITDLVVVDNDLRGNRGGPIGSAWAAPLSFISAGYGSWARNDGYQPVVTALQAGEIPFTGELLRIALPMPTTVLGITKGRAGDQVTLVFTNGNATLLARGGSLVLRDQRNANPPPQANMSLQYDGDVWRELTRTFGM